MPMSEPQIGPKCIPQTPRISSLGSHDHWRGILPLELCGPQGLRSSILWGPQSQDILLLLPLGNTRASSPILQM